MKYSFIFVNKGDTWPTYFSMDFTLLDFLFEVLKLTKNADPDKYGYSGYDIRFGARLKFLLSNGE